MNPSGIEFKWRAPEFARHERTVNWFLVLWSVVIFVSLILFALKNSTGIALAVVAGIALHISALRHPRVLEFMINAEGVGSDGTIMPFSEMKHFSIVEAQGDLDEIIFDTHKFHPARMRIILDPKIRVEELRAFLAQFLKEVDHEEGLIESLSKLLKI